MKDCIDLAFCLKQVREKNPLVHHITNYVTANDCANAVLAAGASPVMADAPGEAEAVTKMADGLVLNLGTLHTNRLAVMKSSAAVAGKRDIPVVLDPVGCGAIQARRDAARTLLETGVVSAVRGNYSEIAALSGMAGEEKGVDSSERISEKFIKQVISFAQKNHLIVAATGKIDLVTDGSRSVLIRNGCEALRRITGSGCMATSLCGAFCAANRANTFEAVVSAIVMAGLAGEKAWAIEGVRGLGHFHMGFIDALGTITIEELMKGAVYEEI